MSKPWLPLPIGLKPPSAESVLAELSRQGISAVPSSSSSSCPINGSRRLRWRVNDRDPCKNSARCDDVMCCVLLRIWLSEAGTDFYREREFNRYLFSHQNICFCCCYYYLIRIGRWERGPRCTFEDHKMESAGMYIDLRHETLTSRNPTCVSIFVCGLSRRGPLKNLIVETFLGDEIKL